MMHQAARPIALLFIICLSLLYPTLERVSAQSDTKLNPISDGDDNDSHDPPLNQSVVWHPSLKKAVDAAGTENKPILAVVGAEWCIYCKKLESELSGSVEKEFSQKWVLAKIDADESVSDARELRAAGLPAIRLLSPDGFIAAGHDGFLKPGPLREFLNQHYDSIKRNLPRMLDVPPSEFTDDQVEELVAFSSIRDVTIRRVILDRLEEIPNRCADSMIDRLETGKLADQLAALELLRRWKAPVEAIDPWKAPQSPQRT